MTDLTGPEQSTDILFSLHQLMVLMPTSYSNMRLYPCIPSSPYHPWVVIVDFNL
jgi:hypothetical protein